MHSLSSLDEMLKNVTGDKETKRNLPIVRMFSKHKNHLIFALPKVQEACPRRRSCAVSMEMKILFQGFNLELVHAYSESLALKHKTRFIEFAVLRCSENAFYEDLLNSIHKYNAHSASPNGINPPLIIFPGPVIRCICAAVAIQSCWRQFLTRKKCKPQLIHRLVVRRKVIFLQRWWRNMLFNFRCKMLHSIKEVLNLLQTVDVPQTIVPKLRLSAIKGIQIDPVESRPFPTTFYVDPFCFSLLSKPNSNFFLFCVFHSRVFNCSIISGASDYV